MLFKLERSREVVIEADIDNQSKSLPYITIPIVQSPNKLECLFLASLNNLCYITFEILGPFLSYVENEV